MTTSSLSPAETDAAAAAADDEPRAGFIATRLEHLRHGELGIVPVVLALAAIWAYFAIDQEMFLSSRNLTNLLLQSAVVGTLALGISIVLILGEIDLSVAAVAGVSAAVMAQLLNDGWSIPAVVVAALAVGIAIGTLHGFFVSVVRVPSFVVTLAGLLGFQGLMLAVLGDNGAINVDNDTIRGLTTTYLTPEAGYTLAAVVVAAMGLAGFRRAVRRRRAGLAATPTAELVMRLVAMAAVLFGGVAVMNDYNGVPLIVVLVLLLTFVLTLLMERTSYGRYVYAVGGNAEAARRAGISLTGIRISAFMLLGAVVAIGGIFGASRYASVSFNAFAGGSLLLEAIGAAVIGGTSLFGGHGRIANALLGALVMGSLSNGLDLIGASAASKLMFSGAILLLAVTVDALSRRGRGAAGR